MRASLLLFAAIGCLRAQPEAGDLLQRVTQKVLDTVGRLPKYMCTQTIERQQYEPAVGSAGRSCEPYARKQLHLTTSDRLRFDVAISGGREMYSWVGESRFEDRSLFELAPNGATSTGTFVSFLMVVFRDDQASFTYKGESMEQGRRLAEYEFRVPVQSSHYSFSGAGAHVTTGYFGSILVDRATAELVRLAIHTEALPPETGSCESTSTLDYSRARLNGADFLLPSRVQLHILDANGFYMENSTVYSACHEFLGESTLRFDEAPEVGENASKSATAGDLPGGLPFTIALTGNIDQTTAAAGDRISAKLTTAITDAKHQVLVPKGAAVRARIVQTRRFYLPQPSLRLILKLETVETAGAPRPLKASPDTRAPALNNDKGTLQRRESLVSVSLDNQDPQAGVFVFLGTTDKVVAFSGFESKWLTRGQ